MNPRGYGRVTAIRDWLKYHPVVDEPSWVWKSRQKDSLGLLDVVIDEPSWAWKQYLKQKGEEKFGYR